MKFCQDHWDRLRVAIEDRDLDSLIAPDGATAVAQQKAEFEGGEQTATTFDPLMSAHWAIVNNVSTTLQRVSPGAALYLLWSGDEDPVEGYPGYEGRTWPRCPLCYIGLAHEVSCSGCHMPKVDGYAWMIDRAADDALARARELGLREAA